MKRFFILMLICSSAVCSSAAVFQFKGGSQQALTQRASEAWAIDFGVARQWYSVWASSAEMVYHNVVAPANASRRIGRIPLLDTIVFGCVSLLLVAAAGSAARSVNSALAMRRRMAVARNSA